MPSGTRQEIVEKKYLFPTILDYEAPALRHHFRQKSATSIAVHQLLYPRTRVLVLTSSARLTQKLIFEENRKIAKAAK